MAKNEIIIVTKFSFVVPVREKRQREIRRLLRNLADTKTYSYHNILTTDIFAYFADIDVDNPDKKLIIMYLTELYNYLEGNKAKERVCKTCLIAYKRKSCRIIIINHMATPHVKFRHSFMCSDKRNRHRSKSFLLFPTLTRKNQNR